MHIAKSVVVVAAVAGAAGVFERAAQANFATYAFTGTVSQLIGTGNVLGVQGVMNDPISGTLSVDESLAFITSGSGAQASPLMGAPGIITVNIGGHTFSTGIDQMVVYQQFSPGMNLVSAFTIAFTLDLDGVPQNGFPRANMAVQFAFPSATGFANGPLTGLSGPDFTDAQSYGVILEDGGNSPEDTIYFTFDSFTPVPAPGTAGVLVLGIMPWMRRRK